MAEHLNMAGLVALAAVLLLCCLHLSTGFTPTPKPASRNPYDSFVGTSCRPPIAIGFRPNSCGDYEVLTEVVTSAPVYVYGPNTCRFLQDIRRNELNYEYSKYCDWVYSKNYYAWVQQCQLICLPTRTCSDRNQTIEVSAINCCPGFQTRPTKVKTHYNRYYQQHYTPINSNPTGCPLAVGESISDCLRLHNLTRFLSFVEMSSYRDLINSNNSGVTVLAPTNEAFDLVDQQLLSMTDVDMLVGNHIINMLLSQSDFQHTTRLMSILNLTLHSTLIHFPDYSVITYHPNTQYSSDNPVEYRERRFINGAGIENPEACRTDNGMLHIINRVLMPSSDTIHDILLDDPRFSMFVEALMAAGTFEFLNETGSHTVFAPTDDVFERDIPPDLLNCLISFMRVPLTNLILYHISKQTDYSQVLSLRQSAFSLFTDYHGPRSIVVFTAENNTIFLGELGNQIPVTQADIPASNGVIHEIGGVLMPPNFNYGQCQRFVPTPPPTTPPPTTPPPTTAPPTTDPPTTDPPTIAAPTPMITTMAAPGPLPDEDFSDYGLSNKNI